MTSSNLLENTFTKENKTMKKTLLKTFDIISIVFWLWLLFSYLEIAFKNIHTPLYSNYNLIVITFKHFNNILQGGIF